MSPNGRSAIFEATLAVAAVVLLLETSPWAQNSSLFPTLAFAPLFWVGLRAFDRETVTSPQAGIGGRIEGVLWTLWLILVLQSPRLGLLRAEDYLMASLALLLGGGLLRRLPHLRRALGTCLPASPPRVFFLWPLGIYLLVLPWVGSHRPPDGDEPYNLLMAHSLAHDLDADLANNYAAQHAREFLDRDLEPQIGDPQGPDGQIYSRHNLLLPLLLMAPYGLAGRWGAMVFMAILSAALAWMVLRLAHYYAPQKASGGLLAWALFAFTPPMLLYSHQIWVEVPAALLLTFALDRLLTPREGPWTLRDILLFALPVVLLPILKMRFGLMALSLIVLAVLRQRLRGRPLGWLLAGLVSLTAALLVVNHLRYGHPLKLQRWDDLMLGTHTLGDFLQGAVGTFFDSAFGLFFTAPIWWLILPALVLAIRQRSRLLVDTAILVLPYSLMFWPRVEWFGGWSPPFRYPLVYLPLLALLLVPLLQRRARGLQRMGAGLLVLTLLLTTLWLTVPAWTYNLADGRSDLLDHLSQRFGGDVARLFPSTIRPRPATWWWPLLGLLLIPLALDSQRRRALTSRSVGVAWVLLLASAVPWATLRLPTQVLEVEDAYLKRHKSLLFPAPWAIQRARFAGGRLIKGGGQLEAPVVPDGDLVNLLLIARATGDEGPQLLQVLAGDQLLIEYEVPEADSWQTHSLGPFPWATKAPLVLRVPNETPGGVLIDRIEFQWSR